jgi:hypothetical protein
LVSITRDAFGWPTRSRASAFTAFAAENFACFRFFMPLPRASSFAQLRIPKACVSLAQRKSMDEIELERKALPATLSRSPSP